MSCFSCQNHSPEIDLGCQHFYCNSCIIELKSRCKEGCPSFAKIPIQDARDVLESVERELEALESETAEKIDKLEKAFNEHLCQIKRELERKHSKVKKANLHIESLLARSQYSDLVAPVLEYAKVHLGSKCKQFVEGPIFYLVPKVNSDGKISASITKNEIDFIPALELVSNLEPANAQENLDQERVPLSIIAKSRDMIAFECEVLPNIIIANIKTQTAVESPAKFPKTDLLFFRDGELVSCPVPQGFACVVGNVVIRPHPDGCDRFELFDPAVGKLELVILDSSMGVFYKQNRTLNTDLDIRVDVITFGVRWPIGIPYLDQVF